MYIYNHVLRQTKKYLFITYSYYEQLATFNTSFMTHRVSYLNNIKLLYNKTMS